MNADTSKDEILAKLVMEELVELPMVEENVLWDYCPKSRTIKQLRFK